MKGLKGLLDALRSDSWLEEARCRDADAELFFGIPGRTEGEVATALAKLVCNGDGSEGRPPCPVREQCLEFALNANEKFGVWGGLDERERRKVRRDRRARRLAEEREAAEREAATPRRRRVVRREASWK